MKSIPHDRSNRQAKNQKPIGPYPLIGFSSFGSISGVFFQLHEAPFGDEGLRGQGGHASYLRGRGK
jgi:hypothetical protein